MKPFPPASVFGVDSREAIVIFATLLVLEIRFPYSGWHAQASRNVPRVPSGFMLRPSPGGA